MASELRDFICDPDGKTKATNVDLQICSSETIRCDFLSCCVGLAEEQTVLQRVWRQTQQVNGMEQRPVLPLHQAREITSLTPRQRCKLAVTPQILMSALMQ